MRATPDTQTVTMLGCQNCKVRYGTYCTYRGVNPVRFSAEALCPRSAIRFTTLTKCGTFRASTRAITIPKFESKCSRSRRSLVVLFRFRNRIIHFAPSCGFRATVLLIACNANRPGEALLLLRRLSACTLWLRLATLRLAPTQLIGTHDDR